jgi:hypothetical protein
MQGAEDGFSGLLKEELLNNQDYLDGAVVGERRYRRFIASTVDHGDLVVESIEEELMAMVEERSEPDCVSLDALQKGRLLNERKREGPSPQESHSWAFGDLFRLAEETERGGCVSFS